MKFYLVSIALLLMTCSLTAQNPVRETKSGESEETSKNENLKVPEIMTKVNLLGRMEIDGQILTFKKVESDGRCPKQVTCVWAGEARVVVEISDGEDEVVHPVIVPADGCHKEILATAEHKVYIKNLEPYPVTADEHLEAYQLVLKVEPRKTD